MSLYISISIYKYHNFLKHSSVDRHFGSKMFLLYAWHPDKAKFLGEKIFLLFMSVAPMTYKNLNKLCSKETSD